MDNTVYEYIKQNPDSSIKLIALHNQLSEDQVRYKIKALGEKLIKSLGRPARYSIMPQEHIDSSILEEEFEDIKEEADIEDLEEAIKKDKPKRKILTSQKQLNEMADNCMILGNIDMEYSKKERYWIFTKGDVQRKVKSKDLPAIRINLSEWIKENFNAI